MLSLIGGVVVGLIIGFIVGKFWKSKRIDGTVRLAKEIADNPGKASELGKQIGELWK